MYIARRTGGGRGVYEIAGETATGLTSSELLGREVVLDFSPSFRIPTGVVLDVQGGKHRLRMASADIQIQRQFAAALMMPSPRRVNNVGDSPQVLLSKEYVIERIHIDFANHMLSGKAFVVPGLIEARNRDYEHTIETHRRYVLVRSVWQNWRRLPEPLQASVRLHELLVTSGHPISADCEKAVSRIQRDVCLLSAGAHCESLDPMPELVSYLDLGNL